MGDKLSALELVFIGVLEASRKADLWKTRATHCICVYLVLGFVLVILSPSGFCITHLLVVCYLFTYLFMV